MSLRRLTRWTLAVVSGIILLIATSAVVVQSAWFKERLRRIAVTRGSEVLNGQLSIGQLKGSLLHGVELSHVVFQQTAGPVVSVETVSVRYDWRLLIKRQFVFDEIAAADEADGCDAHLYVDDTTVDHAHRELRVVHRGLLRL